MKNELSGMLPKMLFGEELKQKLAFLPEYKEEYRKMEPGKRLLKLMDLYQVFVPQSMAIEIYQKLYTMTVMSLNQKCSKDAIHQLNHNHMLAIGGNYRGISTGASSATIIGNSGIGKTSCLQRSLDLFGEMIQTKLPYRKVIPAILTTCPFDCNYKGLLCQILISIDEKLGTNYYERSVKATFNSQQMLAQVCSLCQLHVGVLIIDEIQFLMQHKSGTMLYRMILQLINASGISVLLVGTNECLDYFQQAPQMSRRTVGLQYGNLEYASEFRELAQTLFQYQFLQTKAELTEGKLSWLFEHSAGNPAALIALIYFSQEIAISKGTEKMDIASMTEGKKNV